MDAGGIVAWRSKGWESGNERWRGHEEGSSCSREGGHENGGRVGFFFNDTSPRLAHLASPNQKSSSRPTSQPMHAWSLILRVHSRGMRCVQEQLAVLQFWRPDSLESSTAARLEAQHG